MTPAHIRFLIALGSAVKNGAVKTIKQAMAFAKQQFGKVDEDFTSKIINVFKKEGKTKKGDVVPIKKKEGIMATDEATKIAKKRTDDIVKVFKKEGKTKKGDVVPIKKKEGILATDEATKIVKKRTKDIAKGDPTGEVGEIMEGLGSLKNIKQK